MINLNLEMVNRQQANEKSKEITESLNKKIDLANQDPRLMNGRKEGEWYRPIRRTTFSAKDDSWHASQCDWKRCGSPCWGNSDKHLYEWNASFEWGNSKSSDGLVVKYYPNPLEHYEGYSEDFKKEKINAWQNQNPEINLSKELFELFSRVTVVSNDFNDVLRGLDELINEIVESRSKVID